MRRTKEEAEATKRNIMVAALEVFSSKGYAATRVEDIAEQADVTTGAIYHHFNGKSDLYVKLMEDNSARINQIAQQIIEEGGTPATILRRLLVRMFRFVEEDKEYRAAVELSLKITDTSPEQAALRENILESRRILATFFSELIRDGIQAGEFRPGISPEDAALVLVGFMNGIGLVWIQDRTFFSVKERAEGLIDTFLGGLVQ